MEIRQNYRIVVGLQLTRFKMSLKRVGIFLLVPIYFMSMAFTQSAHAESYMGTSIGVSLSSDANDISLTNVAATGTLTNLNTNSSFAYGIKAGHYFQSIPWFGIEFNYYQRDPDMSKQMGTAIGNVGIFTAAATGQGKIDVKHLSTYGFLTMFRATAEQAKNFFDIQYYLGLGIAINNISLGEATVFNSTCVKSNACKSVSLGSDTSADFLLSVGLNYNVANNFNAYSEYKFTNANFSAQTDGTTYDFDLDDSSVMFGASYHF
jgi:opacity protein-like surface antigen